MKNSYVVENEYIIFRRAKKSDNFMEIAELIYETDPYIYPFWFNNNLDAAKKFLVEKMSERGFIFHYENIYVAYDTTIDKIIGMICALDKSVDLNYDYSAMEKINSNYKITVNKYIKGVIDEVINNDFLYLSNVCIDTDYRGKKIGTKLLGYYISQMEKAGFEKFALDCLLHNLRAKNLYHRLGFVEIAEVVGFDGTDDSKVEVVSMLRKKGDYLPEEFKSVYNKNYWN